MSTHYHLLDLLKKYIPHNQKEQNFVEQIKLFVQSYENPTDRNLSVGHITTSARIVDESKTHALLTHHGKLNKRLQLGGHVEGESDMRLSALREAQEESWLQDFVLLDENIFSLDVHTIPARGDIPEHIHYDLTFVFQTDRNVAVTVSDESHDVQRFSFDQMRDMQLDDSVRRMIEKSFVR